METKTCWYRIQINSVARAKRLQNMQLPSDATDLKLDEMGLQGIGIRDKMIHNYSNFPNDIIGNCQRTVEFIVGTTARFAGVISKA